MKYLQSYKVFEGKVKSDDKIKIKEFCDNHLAYLLDDGFLVNTKGINTVYINISKPYIRDNEYNIIDRPTFKWNDIKYDVIPLLLLLQDKIDIITFFSKSDNFNKSFCQTYKEYYSIDSEYNNILKGDDIENSSKITAIEIELSDEIFESKVFESKFVSKDDLNDLLDKISSSGITSLSDIDKKRLTLFTEGDKEIIQIIDEMGDVTLQFKELNKKLKELSDQGKDGYKLFVTEWGPLNIKMVKLEKEIESYGIMLGDPRLTLLMKRERPDAYNTECLEDDNEIFESKSNIKFTKKEKKKDAKTDTYDVSKSGTVIGQVKWSSRMRGYAFVPTTDCDNEIKEFVKELMRKRREDKK